MTSSGKMANSTSGCCSEAATSATGGCCGAGQVATEQPDQVRGAVATSYAKAVTSSAGSCCGGGVVPKGVAANLAGYARGELGALPADAVVNSFGCGNPLAFAGVKEGDVVLDLGSGAGIDILIAGKMVGPTGRAIGVDMTDEMIERAGENVRAAGLNNVEVRKGIIEKLPIESDSVDWVISNCVINLSPEKDRVFSEIHRVLKPGGRLSVSDIVVKDLPDWVRSDAALHSSCIAGAISEEEYVAWLHRAGLDQVRVTERLVYDEAQLAAFAQSEELDDSVGACCGGGSPSELARRVAAQTTGKIWSAKFVATKPGG
jgi:arsenite methyltransferase